jgi:aryl-alcohol dehydrogenase-like predicted oxidoreductase
MFKIDLGAMTHRRNFLRYLVMLGLGVRVLLRSGDAAGAGSAAAISSWPKMSYRKLGRTGFQGSRLVFGCGKALSRRRKDALLNAAFDAGVNVFDVGSSAYYKDAEQNLAPFLKKVRDDVFLISKAMVSFGVKPEETVTVQRAKTASTTWLEMLHQSLRELQVDRVDAYYLMAANNPSLIASDEIHGAFLKAKQAGKVSHLGLSTHQNAQKVLETAVQTGWYDLAMIAITPAGWSDWKERAILRDSAPMAALQPVLDGARASGMGLIGMKAGRHLAGRRILGWERADAFDEFYDDKLLASNLSAFQRSYAFVLAHGLDAVNAHMRSLAHLHENFVAAATSPEYPASP